MKISRLRKQSANYFIFVMICYLLIFFPPSPVPATFRLRTISGPGSLEPRGRFVDLFEDPPVNIGQFEASPPHHPRRYLHEHRYGNVTETRFRATVRKTRYEGARESGSMKVNADADDCGCVEHAVDACFGMISHYQTAELQVGPHEPPITATEEAAMEPRPFAIGESPFAHAFKQS